MLFYRKKLNLQAGNTIKLSYSNFSNINSITDENILPLKYAKSAYNYILENGALKTGFGFCDATLPLDSTLNNYRTLSFLSNNTVPHKIWYYKYYSNTDNQKQFKIVVLDTLGYLYYLDIYSSLDTFIKVNNVVLNLDSVAVNYNLNGEDVLIISSPDGVMGYLNGRGEYVSVQNQQNQPDIVDMTIHYERLFAIGKKNPKRLYFSDDLDPTNWTQNINDAGFIDFFDELGEVKRVFSFNDYLYVLREYGISKVSAFGDQEQFYVTHCFTSNTRIYENTACLCGETLIFLARDGLYAFNGISTSKISVNIDNMFCENNSKAVSCFYDGCYYLSCKLNFLDDKLIGCESENYVNNAMICLNIKTRNLSITRGIDIKYFLPFEDENISQLFCLFNTVFNKKIGKLTKNGKFFNNSTIKMWISPLTDLGYADKRKVIKEIYLRTKYDCYIQVITEKAQKRIKVHGSNGVSRVPVNVIGTVIAINFETLNSDAEISNPQLIINLLGSL